MFFAVFSDFDFGIADHIAAGGVVVFIFLEFLKKLFLRKECKRGKTGAVVLDRIAHGDQAEAILGGKAFVVIIEQIIHFVLIFVSLLVAGKKPVIRTIGPGLMDNDLCLGSQFPDSGNQLCGVCMGLFLEGGLGARLLDRDDVPLVRLDGVGKSDGCSGLTGHVEPVGFSFRMGLFIFQIFQMFFNGASADVCGGKFQFVLAAVHHDLWKIFQHAQGEAVADGKDFQFFRTDNGRRQKH